MIRTFKTQLVNVTAEQALYFNQAIGTRRWVWNWAMEVYFEHAEKGIYLQAYALQKELNRRIETQPELGWLSQINSMVRQEALKDFNLAIVAWLKHVAKQRKTAKLTNANKHKPRFQKRGVGNESFRMIRKNPSTPIRVQSNHKFILPRTRELGGLLLQTRESIEFLKHTTIKTITISRNAGNFFISVTYERSAQKPRPRGTGTLGIDMGIAHVAVTYDGQKTKTFDLPQNLRKAEKKTERIQRIFARTKKDSKNRRRIQNRLQAAYQREANIKKDFREKLTTHLVSHYDTIHLESFAFSSAKDLDINRALHRVSSYAFVEALKRKSEERGVQLVEVPKGTPTTQTCSSCGHLQTKKLELKDRVFTCEVCENTLDRDKNAAKNIYNLK